MTQQILEKLESDVWLFYYFNLIGFVVTLWLEIIICLSNRSFATASTSYKCKTCRGGTNTRPDPDTSGNRCAKPDPRYPTRLSAKVLITRIANYSTLLCHLHFECKVFAVRIFWKLLADRSLGYQSAYSVNKPEMLMSFANPHWVNPTRTRSWFQLAYSIPNPTRIFSARSTPTYKSWHLILISGYFNDDSVDWSIN